MKELISGVKIKRILSGVYYNNKTKIYYINLGSGFPISLCYINDVGNLVIFYNVVSGLFKDNYSREMHNHLLKYINKDFTKVLLYDTYIGHITLERYEEIIK